MEHHLHVGDSITPYRTNLDGCGYVIVKRSDIRDALAKADEIKNIIDINIFRE